MSIEVHDDGVVQTLLISADLVGALLASQGVSPVPPPKIGDEYRFLDPDAAQRFRSALDITFKTENPVTIDGERIEPVVREMTFVDAFVLANSAPMPMPPDVEVILFYQVPVEPKRVDLVWTIFPQDAMRASFGLPVSGEVVAELDAYGENRIVVFSKTEPGYVWHAPREGIANRVAPVVAAFQQPTIPVPALSAALVGLSCVLLVVVGFRRGVRRVPVGLIALSVVALGVAGLTRDVLVLSLPSPWGPVVELPSDAQAAEVFRSLQTNVYRAFEQKEPSDIYDVLAYSVDGELLDEVYNEVYQSLILRDQGGAVARIKGVEILHVELDHAGVLEDTHTAAFGVQSRWRVHGAVYHWGHVHSRTNEYTARFTIAQRDGNWRITGIADLEGQRIVGESDDPA